MMLIGLLKSVSKLLHCAQFLFCWLSISVQSNYIEDAGSPAMAINGYRNKPIGPGGGTRRLHHKPVAYLAGF